MAASTAAAASGVTGVVRCRAGEGVGCVLVVEVEHAARYSVIDSKAQTARKRMSLDSSASTSRYPSVNNHSTRTDEYLRHAFEPTRGHRAVLQLLRGQL